jgi:hypothetical protein
VAVIGRAQVLVNLDAKTKFVLADGSTGSVKDLVGSQRARVSGLLNTRTQTMVQTTLVRILSVASYRVAVSVTTPTIAAGKKEVLIITLLPGTRASISIRYPNGATTRASVTSDSKGTARYSFVVPANANSVSSQTAVVQLSSSAGTAKDTFSIKRAPIEVYAHLRSIKAGSEQTIELIGSRHARVELHILWPGNQYLTHTLQLGSTGRATYRVKVPKSSQKGQSGTTTVEAVLKTSTGSYLATTTFHVTP